MRSRRLTVLAGLAAVAVFAAACGGDDTAGGDSGDSGDNGANGGGEPIKIMTIGTLESPAYSTGETEVAVKAAVKAINADGGIDGRMIEPSFCNDKFDPNEAAACGQRAVTEGVVAVIGGATPHSTAFLPILEAAKIPLIAGSASSGPPELESPISYPLQGGAPAFSMGAGALAAAEGSTVAVVADDNDGSKTGAEFVIKGAEANGADATMVVVPLNTADATPTVNAILDMKPDAVVLSTTAETGLKVVTGVRQMGFDGLISGVSSQFPPANIEALGDLAENIRVTSRMMATTATDVPEIAEFREQMEAEDSSAAIHDLSLNAWVGVRFFAETMAGHEITDGASVIDVLENWDGGPVELGVAPAWEGIPDEPDNPDFPRVSKFQTITSVINDGELVRDGDWFNPLDGAN